MWLVACCLLLSGHPDLNEYIVQVLQSLKPLVKRDEVEEFAVVIRDREGV